MAKVNTGNKVTYTGKGIKPKTPKTGAKPPKLPNVTPGQTQSIPKRGKIK